MSAPCPFCGFTDGFHDNEEPDGKHAAVRARIDPAMTKPPSSSSREAERQARHAANQAWLAAHRDD